MPGLLLFAALVSVLAVGLMVRFRTRAARRRDALRTELFRKLERGPAHAGALIDELKRSGSVRPPRVLSLLERMRADGTLSSAWQYDEDRRPRRVYRLSPE